MLVNTKTLELLRKTMDQLQNTSSTADKVTILRDVLTKDKEVGALLDYACNPSRQFYLSSEVAFNKGFRKPCFAGADMHDPWDTLSNRIYSGNTACNFWISWLSKLPAPLQPVANQILDKDLQCNIGVALINKAFILVGLPKIPVFQVALGEQYKGEAVWLDDETPWFASRKLDGVRCLAILGVEKEPTFLSRTGKAFTSLNRLADVLRPYKGSPIVLDGELALSTKDGSDDFQGIMKQIRRKDYTIPNIRYHVFDCIPYHDFLKGWGTLTLTQRWKELLRAMRPFNTSPKGHIQVVAQSMVSNEDMLAHMMDMVAEKKWEGLILRKDVPYLGKRSSDLLKVKTMHDLEAKVIGVDEGNMTLPINGQLKSVCTLKAALIKYKDHTVKVGSGWSVEQRVHYFKHPEQLVGKVITVQYFEETKNQKGGVSLRFPVVKCVHGEEREF
jgi:DNA ligase-1